MGGRNYSLGSNASRGDGNRKGSSRRQILYFAQVISADDPEAAGRIKVRIKGLDDKKTNEDIPYCWPFLPLYLNIIPKKGETVKIILYDAKNEDSYREYIGPIIPQIGPKLIGSDNFNESKAGREGVGIPFSKSIKSIATAKDGLYPKEDEIAIQGRNNTDIIFRDSNIMIRAAKFLPNQPIVKNEKNPAYIEIKTTYPKRGSTKKNGGSSLKTIPFNIIKDIASRDYNETRTDINLVSNKLFLIGRDTNSAIVKAYPSDEEWKNMEDKLHPIVYGDILHDFIKKLFEWVKSHQHPYHNVVQNPSVPAFIELQRWVTFDLPKLLSKNIFAGGDIPKDNKNITDISKKINSYDNSQTRINADTVRFDEKEESPVYLTSSKICIDGICRVDFQIVNKINGSLLYDKGGEGPDEASAYTNALTELGQFLNQPGFVKPSMVKIPQLNEIKIF